MRIKTKVALGVVFLFFVILTVGGLGFITSRNFRMMPKIFLSNNYESLVYTQKDHKKLR